MLRGGSRMQGFARQRAQRFQWQKLVSAYTPQEFIAYCQGAEKEIAAKNMLASTIPKEVPKIDWAHWKTQISAPGVVDQLQKEYESIVFTDQTMDEFAGLKAENDAMVAVATAELGAAKAELARADKAVQAVQQMKAEGLTWTADQWIEKIPGLEAQMREAFDNEEYLPSDEEEKVAQLDFADLQKDFLNGTFEAEPSAAIGDLDLKEEKDLIERGEWSISRLFTNREGREKLLEEVRKANKDAQAAAASLKA